MVGFGVRRFIAALLCALTIGSTLLALSSASAQPNPADVKSGLKAMFDAGWQRTTKGREAAQRQYDRLRAAGANDAQLRYAYTLVQLRQYRYPDAAKLIAAVVNVDKANATALKLKIWLSAVTKEYPEALSAMERLVELLPRDAAAAKTETPHRDTVEFLGRMCGYFEGPGQDAVDELLAVKCRQRITDRLSTAQRAVFEEARRGIVEQFTGTSKAIGEKAAESEAEATKQRERDLAEMQDKAEKLAAQIKEMEARNAKLKQDLDYELQKFAQREQPLVTGMQQIEVQIAPLRDDIRSIDIQIANLVNAASQEKDAFAQQALLNSAANWRLRRNQRIATLDGLTRRHAGLANDLAVVQQQKQLAINKYQREAGQVDTLHRTLDRTQKDAARLSGKSITGNTPLVRDQKRKAAAFSTYVPLPISLEDERDRVLEAVR
jgi:DNA repair exonuclease SbcCD ATPase subunit